MTQAPDDIAEVLEDPEVAEGASLTRSNEGGSDMLEAAVVGAGGSNYRVTSDGNAVATMEIHGLREAGTIAGGHGRLTIRREHPTSGAWLLERHDDGAGPQVIASAEKPSAMRSGFIFRMPGRPALQLDRPSAWRPVFELTEADRAAGTIRRVRSLRLRMQADIRNDVPPALQLFVLWTVLLLLRRADHTRAAARRGR